MKPYYWLISVLCLICLSKTVTAHQLSTAYLNLKIRAASIDGTWQLRVRDLGSYISFDGTDHGASDGMILWHEIMAKSAQVAQFTREQLIVNGKDEACPLIIDPQLQLDRHFNEPYVVISFQGGCGLNQVFSLDYRAFFDEDASHKAIINIQNGDNSISRIFTADSKVQQIGLDQASPWQTFGQYLYQGVVHIWQGADHILFLLVLLLTVCFTRKVPGNSDNKESWLAITDKKSVIWQSCGLITAFTLAHSVTLTASALGWSWLPSRYVEAIIALSVLFTALNNIYPVVIKLVWLTFVFGLFHGMGFASVLAELGLAPQHQLLSILAFNLGVELGQLAILAVILPLFILLRFKIWYGKYLIPWGSAAIALVALQWTVERGFP